MFGRFSDEPERHQGDRKLTQDSKQDQSDSIGQVRVRSNVTTNPKARHLIPGDVLRKHGMHYEGRVTRDQHDEMMYYQPCSICKRGVFDIYEFGCDKPDCQVNGVVSTDEASRRRSRYIDP